MLSAVASEDGKLPSDTVLSKAFEIACSPVEFYATGEWQPGRNQTSETMYFVDKVCPTLPVLAICALTMVPVKLPCLCACTRNEKMTSAMFIGMGHHWVAHPHRLRLLPHRQDGRVCQGRGLIT